jgi:glycosyltransferase involved in cell wall biosynthesis
VRIAFHTTLNDYDDGRISGDRRMARQLVAVLRRLGNEVAPLAVARTYMRQPDAAAFAALRDVAAGQVEALFAGWSDGAPAPELWFTYHHYYKAPDLLGPTVATRLGIPYVVAEASDSAGRAAGDWAAQVALARTSFPLADVHFCFTGRDREGLEPWRGSSARFVDLPPFIDVAGLPEPVRTERADPHLVAVAMMRPGNKHESYQALARVLTTLQDRPWRLSLIGDGAMRAAIEADFAGFAPGRITFRGALDAQSVAATLADGDLFVWPGLREAYGLVYLEAQAAGLPVVAFDSGGVPATVERGVTAFLEPSGDEAALARSLARLLDDAPLRRRMGETASRFVRTQRNYDRAGAIIARGLALAREAKAVR